MYITAILLYLSYIVAAQPLIFSFIAFRYIRRLR